MEVYEGEIVALLGTNGAGKSTLLKGISGLVTPKAGTVHFDGREIHSLDTGEIAHLGVAQVPGGRGIFPSLTVEENMRAAGWMYRNDKAYVADATKRVLEYFPILEQRWETVAGSLTVNVAPWRFPGLSACTVPPWSSTRCRTSARPRPSPP